GRGYRAHGRVAARAQLPQPRDRLRRAARRVPRDGTAAQPVALAALPLRRAALNAELRRTLAITRLRRRTNSNERFVHSPRISKSNLHCARAPKGGHSRSMGRQWPTGISALSMSELMC